MRPFCVIGILLYSFSAQSQLQRTILLEQFTHVNCELCEDYNRAFEAIKTNFGDTVIDIRYGTSSPDPFYLNNPIESQSRMNFYGVQLPAHTILDGSFYNGNTSQFSASLVDDRKTSPPKFDIQLSHRLSPEYDSIHIEMIFESKQFIANGQVSARVAVVEREIEVDFPPGTNGETVFYNMLRKFLPDAGGLQLSTPVPNGYKDTVNQSWAIDNVNCVSELGVVAFVQNDTIKGVYQAAWSAPNLQPTYSYDVNLIDVWPSGDFLTPEVCGYQTSPKLKVRNMGSEVLTAIEFGYQVNGGAVQHFQWQGIDSVFHLAYIDLPEISFTNTAQNTLKVWSQMLNGFPDENPVNDTSEVNFPLAFTGAVSPITLVIELDSFPEETTWAIKTEWGSIAHTGGPYSELQGTITEEFTLSPNQCFYFEINDSYGDGLCCNWGGGSYRLVDDNQTIIAEGDSFRWQEVHPFSLDLWPSGTPEVVNPQNHVGMFVFQSASSLYVNWTNFEPTYIYVYSADGKLVFYAAIGQGHENWRSKGSNIGTGVFLIQLVGEMGNSLSCTAFLSF